MAAASLSTQVALQRGDEFFSPSVIFHHARLSFRVGQNLAFMIDDGSAGPRSLSFLRSYFLQ